MTFARGSRAWPIRRITISSCGCVREADAHCLFPRGFWCMFALMGPVSSAHLAFLIGALLVSMEAISSFQDLTKVEAPSS
jgi:hypothetical protein